MSERTVQLWELCCADDNRRFSPFCWRIRLACLHKGLKVETIPWRFTEKDRLKFADAKLVPVLVDGSNIVKESYDIAKYLEKTYPDAPSLFGGKDGEASIRFIDSFANTSLMEYFPALLVDIVDTLDKKDAEYFREDREKMFGGKLEEVSQGSEEMVKRFRKVLEPLRMTLKKQRYIGGDEPNYGDYSVASIIMTGKSVSKLQLLEKDDTVLEWFNRIMARHEDGLKGTVWEW